MRNRKWVWFSILVFSCAVLARLVPGPRTIDDAYITFRYARNILAGNGFLYNPGERILGTTTPLYTLTLVGLGALSGGVAAPFPWLALGVNALADGVTCLMLVALGRRLGVAWAGAYWAGAAAALVWAVAPFSVTFAIGGLETSVYVMLLTAICLAHLAGKRKLVAFLGALAFITRPDALILLGLVGLARLFQLLQLWKVALRNLPGSLREALPELAWFLIPVLMWLGFSTFYFGSPLPHSIAAKSVAYHLRPEEGLIRLIQHYATPFMEDQLFGNLWNGLGFIVNLFLFLVGARRLMGANRQVWPWLAYPWLYFVVFAVANPLIFRWYLTPPLPPYLFAILAGLWTLLEGLFKLKIFAHETLQRLAWVSNGLLLVILPVSLSLAAWTIHPDHGPDRPAPEMAWIKLELLYRQAAVLLSAEIPAGVPAPVLAAGDVGVLGYHTPVQILDTVGLNSAVAVDYYPLPDSAYVINYAVPPDLILDQQPDYVVLLEVYIRNGLLKDPRFREAYRLLHKFPTDIYGSDGMLIFARR